MSIRAIRIEETGGPEVLRIREEEPPVPGEGQLLVQTHSVGLNFIDTYHRSGVYSVRLPFPVGSEASGEVIAVGAGVSDFAVGDRIATAETRGTYAEQFIVRSDRAVRVPNEVGLDVAAAIPLQGLTAHYLATSAAQPAPGETVLVHAGSGGVGLLLTQILVARGVRVVTTASTEEKRVLSREAGAALSVEYAGFAEAVRDFTDGEGVAVVYDGVGKDTFDESLSALRVRGTLVLFGGASGQVPPFDLQRLNAGGSLSVTRPSLTHFVRTPEERASRYRELFAAIAAGTLHIRIGARYPLAEAADAHRALEGRQTTGKVILTV